MYFVDGKRFPPQWIYYAMRCRNDKVGGDEGAGTLDPASIASRVNLADRPSGRTEFFKHFPLAVTRYIAQRTFGEECTHAGEEQRNTCKSYVTRFA